MKSHGAHFYLLRRDCPVGMDKRSHTVMTDDTDYD